jgi:tRNA-splicing ligase RtcB
MNTTTSMRLDVRRLDENRLRIDTDSGLDIVLFANEQVPIDRASLAEISALSGLASTVEELDDMGFFGDEGTVGRCVLTPDFHKGSGIPVGTVLQTHGLVFPRAAGGDIGCGMRLLATDMTRAEFDALGPDLDKMLRHACFEGGRDLPMSQEARASMLRHGAPGLLEVERTGLWSALDEGILDEEIKRSHRGGSWDTDDLWMFADYVRGSGGTSRDAALGSIGGGNHFCEIQWVEKRLDPESAWRWGLHEGSVTVMVHTGSLGLGSMVGDHFMRLARQVHPAGMAMPGHGFHPLPLSGPLGHHGKAYLSAMGIAANFALVNRMVLGFMVLDCLSRAAGRKVQARLVYDAPHNLAWADTDGRVVHRKGACPAEMDMADASFPTGIPVIVPGSMGAQSWVLRGLGGEPNLASAPHGAGRLATRGEGRKGSPRELSSLRVVTKVDPIRIRRDIAEELARDLLEEAPSAYKPVMPAIDTCRAGGIATPVVSLRPLLTVKG